jgi:hypothetical protein
VIGLGRANRKAARIWTAAPVDGSNLPDDPDLAEHTGAAPRGTA